MPDQYLGSVQGTCASCQHQRRLSLLICGLHVRPRIEQHLGQFGIAELGSFRQGARPEVIHDIGLRPALEQCPSELHIDLVHRPVQRGGTVSLCFIDVGARADHLQCALAVPGLDQIGKCAIRKRGAGCEPRNDYEC